MSVAGWGTYPRGSARQILRREPDLRENAGAGGAAVRAASAASIRVTRASVPNTGLLGRRPVFRLPYASMCMAFTVAASQAMPAVA